MYAEHALSRYSDTQVTTGSPGHLVVMLYEGVLRFLREARQAMLDGDHATKGARIGRALHIVQELNNALNPEVEPELCERLASLYGFVETELFESTVTNDPLHLDNATRVLERLLSAWREVAHAVATEPAPAAEEDPDAVATREGPKTASGSHAPHFSTSA